MNVNLKIILNLNVIFVKITLRKTTQKTKLSSFHNDNCIEETVNFRFCDHCKKYSRKLNEFYELTPTQKINCNKFCLSKKTQSSSSCKLIENED